MTPEQTHVASSYGRALGDADGQVILDDLTTFIRGLPLEHQAGGWQVIGHILSRRSAIRRAKARPAKEKKNG